MAVAARELNVIAGQDHAVGVERKVIVDEELGIAAEVENVAVAVDLGDGRVGVVTQQKIVGVRAQAPINQLQAPQRQGNNSAVVVREPQVQVYNAQRTTSTTSNFSGSYASGAAALAATLTYLCTALLCLWALFFTVIAWILACFANHYDDVGKHKCAKGCKICSFCWSAMAIASVFVVPGGVAGGIFLWLHYNN